MFLSGFYNYLSRPSIIIPKIYLTLFSKDKILNAHFENNMFW